MVRRSWYVRALVSIPLALGACGGEDQVGPRVPASIVVVPNEPRVPLGQTKQLTATVVDAAGRAIEDQPLAFVSSNPEILTVSPTGLLTAVGSLGAARITVASGELTAGVDAEAVLPPSAIVVEPRTLALQATQTAFLSVTVTDETSQPVTAPVTFRSTNPGAATVDGFGMVTAVARGTATIVLSSTGRPDAQVTVTVDQVPTTLQVTPTSVVLSVTLQQQLVPKVLDAFGQPIAGSTFTYISDHAAIAAVSSTGLVRAISNGSAIITVKSGTLTATVGVFVGDYPFGTVVATVPLTGGTWGARARGDRYFVTGLAGQLYGGQGTGFDFPIAVPIAGQAIDVDVSADGSRAYVASAFGQSAEGIGVVDLGTQQQIDVLPGAGSGSLLAVALSPDESQLFVGTAGGVERIDLATKTATALPGIAGSVTAFSRNPALPRLYGNLSYNSVVEIDATTGEALRTFVPSGPFYTVQGTAVSADGKRLFAALEDGDLVSWDLGTGAAGPRLVAGGGFGVALSPDGHVLYVARGPNVLLVDPISLALLRTVEVGGNVRRIAVRADGTALAVNEGGWVDFIQ